VAGGKVCELTDDAGLRDGFYNEIAYDGLLLAEARFGWETAVFEPRHNAEYPQAIADALRAGCSLIVVPSGFLMGDSVGGAAEANPGQKFLIIEWSYLQPLENVRVNAYATDQAAFLAGYLAAGVTRTGKVGTFGGLNVPPVADFMNGFALGVAHYNARHGTRAQVLGWDVAAQDGLFAGNFYNAADGLRLGEQLLDEGADILLPVAGPVGQGTAAAVLERGGAWLIGVDSDWAVTYPEYAGIMLTSIEKKLDVSVLLAVEAIAGGTFSGGPHVGTLATGEVGLAPFHAAGSLVSPRLRAELEEVRAGIIAGEMATSP
jgi:basic membrane protein A and related proteins